MHMRGINEVPIFVSYRQVDGTAIARWLREVLHGRSFLVASGSFDLVATLSVYYDRSMPAVCDWQRLHGRTLEQAFAQVVVCTPGAMHEFKNDDWLYREIRWWLDHRSSIAPILVMSSDLDVRWIPQIIRERWPKSQIVQISPEVLSNVNTLELNAAAEMNIQSILATVSRIVQDRCRGEPRTAESAALNEPDMPSMPGLYLWEKDRYFRYIRCNENYARAAGLDSPQAIIGKTDDEMPWRALAGFFRTGDQQVISGIGRPRFHVPETEIMADRVAEILVTENQLLNRHGECVGLAGYFIDISGQALVPSPISRSPGAAGIRLGAEFSGGYLSDLEAEVFKCVLRLYSTEEIASTLAVDRAEIESHIESIKRKLQCHTRGDLIAVAIRSGLPLLLFGQ